MIGRMKRRLGDKKKGGRGKGKRQRKRKKINTESRWNSRKKEQ